MVRGCITHTGNASSHLALLVILMLEVNVGIVSVLTLAGVVRYGVPFQGIKIQKFLFYHKPTRRFHVLIDKLRT